MNGFGRIPVCDVSPVIEHGAYPAKAVVGESAPISATVFREGHDALGATVVLTRPDGSVLRQDMQQVEPLGLDIWEAWVVFDCLGDWSYYVEAWDDEWHTWTHNARIKWAAGQDSALLCLEALALFQAATTSATQLADTTAVTLIAAAAATCHAATPIPTLLALTNDSNLDAAMVRHAPRRFITPSESYRIRVDRSRAQFASWYEFFPRSVGATYNKRTKRWKSGTFDSCETALEHAAQLGFDVVYLPPIHPIGSTMKKGAN
ncbi:MAG: DUF3416 domain-containing protein, partial [Propionibacteriaceae bacterium]|nr:DUF3416 domain-containing protein [Propionibacteriaceae bacterium]